MLRSNKAVFNVSEKEPSWNDAITRLPIGTAIMSATFFQYLSLDSIITCRVIFLTSSLLVGLKYMEKLYLVTEIMEDWVALISLVFTLAAKWGPMLTKYLIKTLAISGDSVNSLFSKLIKFIDWFWSLV